MKFTKEWKRLPYEVEFISFIREFCDKFFKLVTWTAATGAIWLLYAKSKNDMFYYIATFNGALIFLFILSYTLDLQNFFVENSRFKDRGWLQLIAVVFAAILAQGVIAVAQTAAFEIALVTYRDGLSTRAPSPK